MTEIIKTYSELIARGLGNKAQQIEYEDLLQDYSLGISSNPLSIIDKEGIGAQFLPDLKELNILDSELEDPIGDDAHSPVYGLVHRYENRVLIKLLAVCPVYCRFCFRRETVGRGKDRPLDEKDINNIINYIEKHPEINEVILTGGDPLIASPRRIKSLCEKLSRTRIKILRIHTRVPFASPELINSEMIEALKSANKPIYLVFHTNHSNEFNEATINAIKLLRDNNIEILSQTVLLKGINADIATLKELMETLIYNGIKPYYLHHPDLAKGTSHFRISLKSGMEIYRSLSKAITGIALPHYILDIPGGFGKVPINGDHIKFEEDKIYIIDKSGNRHNYLDII